MSREPTTQQWKNLYEAAGAYKQAAIWRWMSNSHLFGIRDPGSGEVGYCCVFGGGGDMFGLAMYIGAAGWQSLEGMFTGELAEDPMFSQYCVLLSFDDREDLEPSEYERIKRLGLRYRGRGAWPTFRLHEPGYVPWPELTAEQAVFMTLALEQAVIVGQACQPNPDALLYDGEGELLLREARPGADGGLEWHNVRHRIETAVEEKESVLAAPLDELRISRLLKGVRGTGGIWETDSFFVPMPIQEEGRPFYPKMVLFVDQESGQILHFALSNREKASAEIVDALLTVIEKTKLLPGELWVGSKAAGEALLPLAEALKIVLRLSSQMPALTEAFDALQRQFR